MQNSRVIFALLLPLAVSTVNAELLNVSSLRSIGASADGWCNGQMNFDMTAALGSYDQAVTASGDVPPFDVPDPLTFCQGNSSADASQDTDITGNKIAGTIHSDAGGLGGSMTSSYSRVTTTFEIDETTDYRLFGEITGGYSGMIPAGTAGDGRVSLQTLDGVVIHEVAQSTSAPVLFDFDGELLAGSYWLELRSAAASSGNFGGSADVVFSFVVPSPGDFDSDGDFECDDIDALRGEIMAATNNLAFDLNGDGVVTNSDIDTWLSLAGMSEIGAAFLMGDADFSGGVDSTDLGLLLNHFMDSSGLGWCSGNFDTDSSVTSTDLGLLLNNFAGTSHATATMAVPEPSSLGTSLVVILASVLGIQSRRRVGASTLNNPHNRCVV